VRNLKTNFYTYAGVVKALDGVNFEMWEGETLGLVGETGCGKSVTALSMLRLIPQPPGKIEEGEVLFDVPSEKLHAIEELELQVSNLLTKVFGDDTVGHPPDLSVKSLRTLIIAAQQRSGKRLGGSTEANALVASTAKLLRFKQAYDLIAKSEEEMQDIRGNRIAMIFQEPMQALNPVFPIGDQIAENILLHQASALAGSVVRKLEAGERFPSILPKSVLLGYNRRVRDHPKEGLMPWIRRRHRRHVLLRALLFPVGPVFLLMERIDDRVFQKALRKEARLGAIEMLRKVKISDPDRIARQYPYELSGGMQQRALIAIALSCNPRLLIADEPTTALDVTIQAQILELITEMKATFGSSVLIITHDLGIIAETCNRVCVMYAGNIVEDAVVRKVFKAPFHPYTQGLMKAIPSHEVRADRLEIIKGSVPNLITPPPGCRFHPRCPDVMPTCGWAASEVADRLKASMRSPGVSEWWPMDPDAMTWTPNGPTELRIGFPEGAVPQNSVELIRRVVETARRDPAIAAISSVVTAKSVEPDERPYHVLVTLLDPRKPPDFEPDPGHRVACLLYEPGRQTPELLEEAHGG